MSDDPKKPRGGGKSHAPSKDGPIEFVNELIAIVARAISGWLARILGLPERWQRAVTIVVGVLILGIASSSPWWGERLWDFGVDQYRWNVDWSYPDRSKISIIVAYFDNDPSHKYSGILADQLQDQFASVDVKAEQLEIDDPQDSTAHAIAIAEAKEWLDKSNANVVIWGSYLDDHVMAINHLARGDSTPQRAYHYRLSDSLEVEDTFTKAVGANLVAQALLVLANTSRADTDYLENLKPVLGEITPLVLSSNSSWNFDDRVELVNKYAEICEIIAPPFNDLPDLRIAKAALKALRDDPQLKLRPKSFFRTTVNYSGVTGALDEQDPDATIEIFDKLLDTQPLGITDLEFASAEFTLANNYERRGESRMWTGKADDHKAGIGDLSSAEKLYAGAIYRIEHTPGVKIPQAPMGEPSPADMDWAADQNGLANALTRSALAGERSAENLAKAFSALRKALFVRRPPNLAHDWAVTYLAVGLAHRAKGSLERNASEFTAAAECFIEARDMFRSLGSDYSKFAVGGLTDLGKPAVMKQIPGVRCSA